MTTRKSSKLSYALLSIPFFYLANAHEATDTASVLIKAYDYLGIDSSISKDLAPDLIHVKKGFSDASLPGFQKLCKGKKVATIKFSKIPLGLLNFTTDDSVAHFRDIELALNYDSGELIRIKISNSDELNEFPKDPWFKLYSSFIDSDPKLVKFPDRIFTPFTEALKRLTSYELTGSIETSFYYLKFSAKPRAEQALLTLVDSTPVWVAVSKYLDPSGTSIIDSLENQFPAYIPRLVYRAIHADLKRPGRQVTVTTSPPGFDRGKFPSLFRKGKKLID